MWELQLCLTPKIQVHAKIEKNEQLCVMKHLKEEAPGMSPGYTNLCDTELWVVISLWDKMLTWALGIQREAGKGGRGSHRI